MKSHSKDTGAKSFRSGFLDLPSGRLTYIDEGEGTPVVIVHGTPLWPTHYRPLLNKLSSQHRCIAIEAFVPTQTGEPADWTYNPKTHAYLVEQLLAHLQLQDIHMLLHDAGTPAGLAYAIQHAGNIRSLMLLNTSSCSFTKSARQAGAGNRPVLHLGKLLYARLHAFRPTLVKKLASSLEAADAAAQTPSKRVLPEARELAEITAWYNEQWQKRSAIQNIATLLLWGEYDKLSAMKSLQKWKQFFHECYVIHLDNSTYSIEGGGMDDISDYLNNFMVEERKKRETMPLSS
ncbi:alpha/beta fold hydrolase [Pontibacter beigongshangensis]|uniref:alpha/beta fold hydrolase n=1 Tax=Pontibacter beigongshangensis TaxID=2574733 RepID=UPI00164FA487|nr:alpha/beta fold hydrolase [Pontibacter beigongshangensis]